MGTILGIVPVIALFAIVVVFHISMNFARYLGGWRRATDRLAQRYKGQIHRGPFPFFYPGATFNYGRTNCRLRNKRGKIHESGLQTDLVLQWPDKKMNFLLTGGNARHVGWAISGLKEVTLQDASFKEAFSIQASDPEKVTRMMNSNVQWAFEQLRRHTFKKSLYVSIRGGKMMISKSGFIKDYSELDDFVRFGLALYDQLVVADVQGIEYLNEQVAKVVEDVKCPICSESVEEFMVVCLRCKTPHCYDCWQYNGRCATFACDETRYVRMDDRVKYAKDV